MMFRFLFLMFFQAVSILPHVYGGEFNRVLSLGDAIPAWSGLVGIDDQEHSLEEFAGAKTLVVFFTCNTCPYAVDVEDRVTELERKYRDNGIRVIAISVNTAEEDSLEAMKTRAKDKRFAFSYLHDPTQKIAREFGATRTPEFFVFNKDRRLMYQGSLDDSPDGQSVTNRYVENAIQATLGSGAVEVNETVPIGCAIRFERVRRSQALPK